MKKINVQQVRRQAIMKLSSKEMLIGENRTMDITILSPTTRFISRSINWKNWSINGCAIGDWEENLTCQDNTNLKRARKYVQKAIINVHGTIFKYLKLNIKSQEMVKVNIQHNAFSNKQIRRVWEIKIKEGNTIEQVSYCKELKKIDSMLMIQSQLNTREKGQELSGYIWMLVSHLCKKGISFACHMFKDCLFLTIKHLINSNSKDCAYWFSRTMKKIKWIR